jgi:homeobox protein HoxA/B/C/D4
MGTGYEPKFPPSETDFHHLHHHAGYGAMNGIAATTNHMDYNYHNGYNYNYGTPSPSTPFYHHHHPPYGSPQMHHPASAPSPNITPQSSSYVTNISNNNSTSVGNRNSSVAPNGSLVNGGLSGSENSPNVDTIGYYNSYYSNTNGHLPPDMPIQCPTTEPPANTALGLQELGRSPSSFKRNENLFHRQKTGFRSLGALFRGVGNCRFTTKQFSNSSSNSF